MSTELRSFLALQARPKMRGTMEMGGTMEFCVQSKLCSCFHAEADASYAICQVTGLTQSPERCTGFLPSPRC
jgi:hypothetical protein